MEKGKRIRVVFKDDDILSEIQKSGGLSRSWVLLKSHQHHSISDVAFHLLHAFELHQSCPDGLLLSISGFVLPPFESSCILKDDEIIRVHKRKDILAIGGNNAANDAERLKALGKQPVNNDLLLLANEEFEKEKGDGPEEVSEEDDEEDLLEDVENPSGSNANKRNRKRKAADKLQCSNIMLHRGKKQRPDATGGALNAVLTYKGKKVVSTAGGCVESNGEPSKLIEKSNASGPSMKGTDEVPENNKETDDAKIAFKQTKKVSRSSRRTYAKRRLLREMATILKQNVTCESEGLQNWKEDKVKAGRKKLHGQAKGQQRWKKHQADTDGNVADGEPKGLLHWTPQDNCLVKGKKRKQRSQNDNFSKLPNRNDDAHEQQIQTGDGHERPTQNGDEHQLPNQKQSDSHEQPVQKSAVQECENQTSNASDELNQESGEENEVVPVVIRPGYIRFEPLGEEQAVQNDHVPQETFRWNGITSKRKGQKWGKESRAFTPRNYKTSDKECNEIPSNEREQRADEGTQEKQEYEGTKKKQADKRTDFDKFSPLLGMPKKGDLIAYRVLELSSSWTPEISPYRVGKVSWFDAESNQVMLMPLAEYPIFSRNTDADEAAQLDSSLYKEDGSLEIDISSLIDARLFTNGKSEPGNEASNFLAEGSGSDANATKTALPSSSDKSTVVPSQDNNSVDIWDQLSETLTAKKEQLSKENGGGSSPKKVQLLQENNWDNTCRKVQHSQAYSRGKELLRTTDLGNNNQPKAQPSEDNKQSSDSKSWSYKALRGSALGPTMAMMRSKKDSEDGN